MRQALADRFGIGIKQARFCLHPQCPAELPAKLWHAFKVHRQQALAPLHVRRTSSYLVRVFKFHSFAIKEYTGDTSKLTAEVAVLQQLNHDALVGYLFMVDEGVRLSVVMDWAGQGLRDIVSRCSQPLPQQQQQQQQQRQQHQHRHQHDKQHYKQPQRQSQRQQWQQPHPLQLGEDLARHIAAQLTHCLAYLESKGIIHRDVKPDNIAVQPDFTIRLFDWSEALLVDQLRELTDKQLLQVAGVAGTPLFMPPEMLLYVTKLGQARAVSPHSSRAQLCSSEHVSGVEPACSCFSGFLGSSQEQQQGQHARSSAAVLRKLTTPKLDVWGLGTVVYFMLAGRDILQHDSSYELEDMAEVINASAGIRLPRGVRVSSAAQDFLQQCLQRDPAMRASASSLLKHPWLSSWQARAPAEGVDALREHDAKLSLMFAAAPTRSAEYVIAAHRDGLGRTSGSSEQATPRSATTTEPESVSAELPDYD